MTREFRRPLSVPTLDQPLAEPGPDGKLYITPAWRGLLHDFIVQAGGAGGDALYNLQANAASVDDLAILREQQQDVITRLDVLEGQTQQALYGLSPDLLAGTLEGQTVSLAILDVTDSATIPGSVPEAREIGTGTGLTGGGDLSTNRTLSLDSAASVTFAGMNVTGAYSVDGTQVLTNQQAAISDPLTITSYTAATISDPPTQAEVQAIADALETAVSELASTRSALKSALDALRTHGAIGT